VYTGVPYYIPVAETTVAIMIQLKKYSGWRFCVLRFRVFAGFKKNLLLFVSAQKQSSQTQDVLCVVFFPARSLVVLTFWEMCSLEMIIT
jgi:hypothetical protein